MTSGASTSVDWLDGEAGDDILVGTPGTFQNTFWGGEGNDVLLPFPGRLTPLGNAARGGAGNDVIVTVNGRMDVYRAGTETNAPLTNACALKVPQLGQAPTPPFAVECTLPWPRPVKGLANVFDLVIARDANGKTTVGGTTSGGLAELTVADWVALRRNNPGAITGDVLLVDLWKSPLHSDINI